MDCLPLLYIGLTTGICILFIVTCLLVNKFFNYEYVDIDGIKESASYKTIYESEITPSNNFLLVSSSKTPFQNPFYMLLVDKRKGYLYEHDNNYKTSDKEALRLNNADERSFRFAHDVENLDNSNQAVPINKDKSVNESVKKNKNTTYDKDNSKNILDKKKAHFEDDDSDDIKYIYQAQNDIANDIGTSDKKKKFKRNVDSANDCKSQTDTCLNTLDACCSAMTFKQIETIMQTDSIAFIDRKTYRNCSTCMSKQYVGQTNVYASTSAPKCLAKCSQVDSEVLGTRKAFKNRCTSVVQIKRVEQWIQTEPVVSKIKIESEISAEAVHENSDEKCEICRLKRIIDEIDMKMEKDKMKPFTYASSSKMYAQNKIQFNVTSKKPAKITTQIKAKKTASRKSSNIQCDCPSKNVVTESTFDRKNKLHELSQQAHSYLERARKITRQMKENNPTIDHYRTVKKDILNGQPLSTHTSKIEINTVYDRNSSKYNSKYETDTLYSKKSQTEVRIKNLIPKMDITIKSPNKNLKHSKIRVRTKQTSNDDNEDISSRNMDTKVYCQPCNSAKSTIKRAAVINSKTKISLSRNKLQINQSSNMTGVSQSASQEYFGRKYSHVTFDDEKQIQYLPHAQRKTKILSETNHIPQTTVKYARALHPRYNIKPSASKNIAPMYFRETVSRTGCLKAPTYNVTQVLPTRNEKICENVYYKNAGLTGNCSQVNSYGYNKYYTRCPLQSSSIRSSQIYPQCLQKKPTQSICYNCNLGLASGKLCRCAKNYNDYPRWR